MSKRSIQVWHKEIEYQNAFHKGVQYGIEKSFAEMIEQTDAIWAPLEQAISETNCLAALIIGTTFTSGTLDRNIAERLTKLFDIDRAPVFELRTVINDYSSGKIDMDHLRQYTQSRGGLFNQFIHWQRPHLPGQKIDPVRDWIGKCAQDMKDQKKGWKWAGIAHQMIRLFNR